MKPYIVIPMALENEYERICYIKANPLTELFPIIITRYHAFTL